MSLGLSIPRVGAPGLLALLGALLPACQPAPECSETIPCAFGSVCVEGACVAHVCATSAQCGMGQHCESGNCVEGCEVDNDCVPGEACNPETERCEPAACEDAQLDCAFGQFCNSATGECYDAAGYYCKPCVDSEDCGGGDNLCLGWSAGDYCGVYCRDGEDCPAGYDCMPVTDGNGNIFSYQCVTYCWIYDDFDADDMPSTAGAAPVASEEPHPPAPAARR